jgi:hypothetical protein
MFYRITGRISEDDRKAIRKMRRDPDQQDSAELAEIEEEISSACECGCLPGYPYGHASWCGR